MHTVLDHSYARALILRPKPPVFHHLGGPAHRESPGRADTQNQGHSGFAGNEEIFDHVKEPGPMWDQDGSRKILKWVEFESPFSGSPAASGGFSLLDVSKASNLRISLSFIEIEPSGFTILVTTWGDMRLAQSQVSWLAIGPG